MSKGPEGATLLSFRIELRGVRPPVWRAIEVPDVYTFWDLHVAIQDAMGWLDCHLHAFMPATGERSPGGREIGIPDRNALAGDKQVLPGWKVPVVEQFRRIGDRMIYVYDFGDEWVHDVELTEILPGQSAARVACIDGARACPPEDCGGWYGYQDLLEILGDPEHEQHADMRAWIGGAFDPEAFDPAAVRFDDPTARWSRAFET